MATESRPCGHPKGRCGPKNARIKAALECKNHLEYPVGTTTFRSNIGAGPVHLRAKAGLSRRELHWLRFQAAGPVKRDGPRSCAAFRPQRERKPDIALEYLRKKTGLVSAGEMNGFAGDGRWRVGNASLLNAMVDDIGRDSRRTRARRACEACAAAI